MTEKTERTVNKNPFSLFGLLCLFSPGYENRK